MIAPQRLLTLITAIGVLSLLPPDNALATSHIAERVGMFSLECELTKGAAIYSAPIQAVNAADDSPCIPGCYEGTGGEWCYAQGCRCFAPTCL